MRYDQVTMAPPLTRITKYLIITCTVIFFSVLLVDGLSSLDVTDIVNGFFGLAPARVVKDLWLWQFVTYIFLHGAPFHLLFNMLVLWFFGSEIEMRMGEKRFLFYFLACGVAAGLCSVGVNMALTDNIAKLDRPVIGCSGAVYGVLAAYCLFFWDRYLLMFFLFPIKAQYYVLIVAGLEVLMGMGQNDNVSHVAHLGGLAFGAAYVYLVYLRPRGGSGKTKRDIEKEKLKRQFTLIVNDSANEKKKDESTGPYWN